MMAMVEVRKVEVVEVMIWGDRSIGGDRSRNGNGDGDGGSDSRNGDSG